MLHGGGVGTRSALVLTLSLTALAAAAQEAAIAALGEAEDRSFSAAYDGTTQRYLQLLPAAFDPEAEHHVLIALHGHGADRWQYATEARDECRAARDAAARYGLIFISPDYRAKTSWMGPAAEADTVQIIAELRRVHRVGKVFLVGGSMGGSSVLTFAALHPELIAGVSSQNGTANHLEYTQFQDAIQASFGGSKQQLPEEYKRRSAEYWPERLTMPVAITAGGKDALVPPHSVVRLAGILRELGRPLLLLYREEGGHSSDYADTTAALDFVVCRALGLPLVNPLAMLPPTGVFFAGQRPAVPDAKGQVDIGLEVSVSQSGQITALHFYKAHGEAAAAHTLRLWSAEGTCLLTVETSGETGLGWQRLPLDPPFPVEAGARYTVSYTATSHYPATAGALAAPIVRAGITALAGVYSFADLGQARPRKTYQQMSYGLDLEYEAAAP
jgi:pimeloyl-ACP methyl ester carboxylesterase